MSSMTRQECVFSIENYHPVMSWKSITAGIPTFGARSSLRRIAHYTCASRRNPKS